MMRNQKGSAILGVLAASAVTMTLIFAMTQWSQQGRDSEARLLIHESASIINSGLVSVLTDSKATQKILTDPLNAAALSCITHVPFNCANGASLGPLAIKNYFNGAISPAANTGFTFGGAKCTTFNAGHGTDLCPLRFEVYASITCPPQVGGICPRANYLLSYQVQIQGSSTSVHYDPNFANLDKGSLLTYNQPANMKCFNIVYASDNSSPGDTSIQFTDNECILSGGPSCTTPAPMTNVIPPAVATVIPWSAPIAGPPASPSMWGFQCTAPYIATACSTVTAGGPVAIAGSILINNGCYTGVPVTLTGPSVDNEIQVSGSCCQLSIPQ